MSSMLKVEKLQAAQEAVRAVGNARRELENLYDVCKEDEDGRSGNLKTYVNTLRDVERGIEETFS